MYLGLDLGTSGLRALLVRGDGLPVGSAEAPYGVQHPASGWSEQDPRHWIAACRAALGELRQSHGAELAAVRALAVAGQMHGAVLLDRRGAVLRPAILWNDSRSHAEAAVLDAIPQMRALSGNIVFPGFTAPKLVWLAAHEPDIFARIDKVLLPKDYLNFWLSGCIATDVSDASGTAWLDVGARAWAPDLLALGGMRAEQMPPLAEGNAVIGALLPQVADELGLARDVVLVAGAGDNAAAAAGTGTLNEGDGFVSLGTSGVLLAARDRFCPDAARAVHSFCHAVPGRWYQMGVVLAAADSLEWLARLTGQDVGGLSAALPATARGPGGVRFLPYLSGERTPHNDSTVRGAFLGLDIADGAPDLARAVMEGVAFALRDSLEALRATGVRLTRLLAIGGGTRSRFWLETLAHTLDLPLELPEQGDFGAALGAARLAISGQTGAAPETVMARPRIGETIHPSPASQPLYEAAYQTYRNTYPAIKALR